VTAIRIAATGDIVLTRPDTDCRDDARVRATQALLGTADVVITSVELPLSDLGHPSDRILNFRGRPELVEELRPYGITVANLANNHSSDYGWAALDDTRNRLEEAGIRAIGAGEDQASAERPLIITVGDRRIGIIARSCLIPLGAAAGPDKPGIAAIHIETSWEVNGEFQLEEPGVPPNIRTWPRPADRDRLLAAVRELAADVDTVIVSLHWGFGFGTDQAEYQRVLAHDLVEAGASAILGHHVHAPQGVEIHRGVPIVYSPGNFIAQQPREGATAEILAIYDAFDRNAFVALLDIDDDGTVGLSLVPIETEADGRPALLPIAEAAQAADHLRSESRRRFATDVGEASGGRYPVQPISAR
jgi:poly-gamma-glutamate capsule biosynthesis protein CapA/YwtB (metallophosphatase superfamily)